MENKEHIKQIADLIAVSPKQISQVLDLTAEGNTIPFIARYRKEVTGDLDEVQIKSIVDEHDRRVKLDERKATVLEKIETLGKLSDELRHNILQADKLSEVEEYYLPYKTKRRTKATIAKERGLFGLAKLIMQNGDVSGNVASFLTDDVESNDAAISGALDILSEAIAEDVKMRAWVLNEIKQHSRIATSEKDASLDEKNVFEMYYEFSDKLTEIPNYRVLAVNRGEKLGVLTVKFEHNWDKLVAMFENRYNAKQNAYLKTAIHDALKSKIVPAMERIVRAELKERAEDGAIETFGKNLRNLLLVAPLKGKIVLGFDPAFRTGAKLAIVDKTGKMLLTTVIYPVKPASAKQIEQAKVELHDLITTYGVEMIAIGNGTASRESEQFVSDVIKDHHLTVKYVIVSESGASVYSASPIAREEFPELTVEKRSAISIARRLQDPLAELVKIEPKAIGVGQYQHDVSEKKLTDNLDFVVETVVNQVGVNVNTASASLLSHVAGLNATIAKNIVAYREANGMISSRKEINKVPRLGAKAFEQAAGFLRIPTSDNILDNTGVHPESYKVVSQLFAELGIKALDDAAREKLKQVDLKQLADQLAVGQATLKDIVSDLLKPGRDLRDEFDAPLLRSDVLSVKDLRVGQKLEGVVRNVVDFGAFVDIGIKEDGLVHVSRMSKKFIKDPSTIVAVGQIVTVWVYQIDEKRGGKVGLSMVELKALPKKDED
ncbi:Tex family protein [Pseudolactococcus plantarum]|uniref:S1 RNA-binding protein n=1 Tax=Pseudolactococcus plantarum TaxID=1365 RepID=A0A2A5S2G5_9LACT|nr:Tex family protein [Lactococcus plantarum]PCS07669.1 S1 RNA-binding protein [Lactococcus plantarum]HCN75090.1 RNA-binding transcriptional accessory protein [Lactococcus sp.]